MAKKTAGEFLDNARYHISDLMNQTYAYSSDWPEPIKEACQIIADARARVLAARRNKARKNRDSMLRSLGLRRVTGALGGVYWE